MHYIGNQAVVGDSANTFKLLDDISSFTVTFDATDSGVVSIANNTLTFNNHRFVTGQKVTYNDGGSKPTESEVNAGLTAMQDAWDLENDSYKSKRRDSFPSLAEQLDMQYWDAVNGTTTWKDAIAKVKSDNPKPS